MDIRNPGSFYKQTANVVIISIYTFIMLAVVNKNIQVFYSLFIICIYNDCMY